MGQATPVGALRIGRSYHGATRVVVITIQHACQGVPTNLHPLTIKDLACSQSISDWFLLTMEPCRIGELLRVAAALQMQLTRDFEPVWKIPAVVSAFTSLDQLPPACLPLIIVRPGRLGPGDHAFHTTKKGMPMGLLEWADGGAWSLAASHELLEMVCDPQGKRKVMGESIADLHRGNVEQDNEDYLRKGGLLTCSRSAIHVRINPMP